MSYADGMVKAHTADHFDIGSLLAGLHRRVYPDRELRAGEQATELNDLDAALGRVPESEGFLTRLLQRVEPHLRVPPNSRVLDVGAAQGIAVAAFVRAGVRNVRCRALVSGYRDEPTSGPQIGS